MILFNPIHVIWKTSFFTIYSWGLFFIIAFIVAGILFYLEARKKGVSQDTILKILLLVLIGAIFGGRLFFVLENLPIFLAKPLDIFAYGQGGETSYGGIILAVLFVWLYLRKNKELSFSQALDLSAPYLALGLAIARIGCFLNWDDFGLSTSLPWGIGVGTDPARHPTQLYELVYCLIIFGLLMWFKKIKEKREISNKTVGASKLERLDLSKAHSDKPLQHTSNTSWFRKLLDKRGSLFLIFLIFYALFRFFNDFLRIYSINWLGFALSQWLLFIVIVASVLILFMKKK